MLKSVLVAAMAAAMLGGPAVAATGTAARSAASINCNDKTARMTKVCKDLKNPATAGRKVVHKPAPKAVKPGPAPAIPWVDDAPDFRA